MMQLAPNIDSFHQSARALGTRFGAPKNYSGITVSKNRNFISQTKANDFPFLYVSPRGNPKNQPLNFHQCLRIPSSNLKHPIVAKGASSRSEGKRPPVRGNGVKMIILSGIDTSFHRFSVVVPLYVLQLGILCLLDVKLRLWRAFMGRFWCIL